MGRRFGYWLRLGVTFSAILSTILALNLTAGDITASNQQYELNYQLGNPMGNPTVERNRNQNGNGNSNRRNNNGNDNRDRDDNSNGNGRDNGNDNWQHPVHPAPISDECSRHPDHRHCP